jgi:hypothetical protein
MTTNELLAECKHQGLEVDEKDLKVVFDATPERNRQKIDVSWVRAMRDAFAQDTPQDKDSLIPVTRFLRGFSQLRTDTIKTEDALQIVIGHIKAGQIDTGIDDLMTIARVAMNMAQQLHGLNFR